MQGSKPRTPLALIKTGPARRGLPQAPAWLPTEAKPEWRRTIADLSRRGLLFDGAMASLEAYCLAYAQVRQAQRQLDAAGALTDGEKAHPAVTVQTRAMMQMRLLATELGLSVVSRARSFQGKSADEREWDDLEVG
jgi:P27 family predicted phage terminase small subunit